MKEESIFLRDCIFPQHLQTLTPRQSANRIIPMQMQSTIIYKLNTSIPVVSSNQEQGRVKENAVNNLAALQTGNPCV